MANPTGHTLKVQMANLLHRLRWGKREEDRPPKESIQQLVIEQLKASGRDPSPVLPLSSDEFWDLGLQRGFIREDRPEIVFEPEPFVAWYKDALAQGTKGAP